MNIALETPNADHFIQSYQPGTITLNTGSYQQSIVIYQDRVITDWEPATIAQLTDHDIASLTHYAPHVIILGTGPQHTFPAPDVLSPAYQRGIGVEVMHTEAACRTYNILVSEGRNVLAALLP